MFEGNEENEKPKDTQIEADFKLALQNANEENSQGNSGPIPNGEFSKSRSGFLDKWVAEQFCDFKNNLMATKLSNDLNQDGKSLVKEVYTTTAEEVEAYLNLAEYGCLHLMPADWLDSMERFFKHPASAVLKVEVMKYRSLSKKLEIFKNQPVAKSSTP